MPLPAGFFFIGPRFADSLEMSPENDDYKIATMMRIDPERLAALRRAMSGMTRCPKCDEPNRADQRYCLRCGSALYPDLENEKADEKESRSEQER
jgi:ribosomal protein L32